MKKINSHTIVFIHGAFVHYSCWDEWKIFFEQNGFTCLAPPWPYKEAPADVLRSRHPEGNIASIRLTSLLDHYISIIKKLPEKPIVIGHSYGGLLTQLIVQRNLAAAGIAIHSLPPQGIIPTQFSFYRSTWKSLGFFTSTKKSYLMRFKDWKYAFTNGMSQADQQIGYERFAVPESKLLVRDALSSAAKVDFKKMHAPLLFTAGSIDHCIPAGLNLRNKNRYNHKNSTADFKVFQDRNHFVLGQSSWKEDAEYIWQWVRKLQAQQENVNKTVPAADRILN